MKLLVGRLKFGSGGNDASCRTGRRGCIGKIIASRRSGKAESVTFVKTTPILRDGAFPGRTVNTSPDATASLMPAMSDDE